MIDENLTDAELADIEQRCSAATSGPWTSFVEARDHTSGSNFIRTAANADIELTGATIADQDFIAHSRRDLPRLVQEVRRLRSLLGSLS